MTKVSVLAKATGTATMTVYRHIQRLGTQLDGHLVKKDRVSYLDDDGVSLVRESLGQTTVKGTTALTAPAPDVAARLEGIERSIMALVEAHGRESASIREQMARLVEENRALRLRLEPPPVDVEPLQVKPWSPDPGPDPAEGMPWWRVAWLSIVAPEYLRRNEG